MERRVFPNHATARCAALLAGGLALLGAPFALAQSQAPAPAAADFYNKKTVTIYVSAAADGGYDRLARTVSKHIYSHIPGKPLIAVRNMPGGGGIIAMNYVANTAPKDGTSFALVQSNAPFEPLHGAKQAEYDATRLNWLGTPSVETGLFAVWHTHPAQNIRDAQRMPIKAGASGHNSAPSFYARLLNEVLKTKIEVVIGFRGQNGAFEAMEKGQIDAYGSTYWSSLVSSRKKLLSENKLRILLQYGPERIPELERVPHLNDLVKDPRERELLAAAYAPLAVGRPFVMAGGVPEERVAAMRRALMDTFSDARFLKDANRIGLVVNRPRNGAELQKLIVETYRHPPAVIAQLRRIANAGKN
ncbi:MAG: hypothetical protein FJX29_07145 [Alphaproteobacteria bacterium]|nr:hypothetical protein [Alphaproteobacteria bacterium]